MAKKWLIQPKITEKTINTFPEIDPVILQLLFNRGIDTQPKIDEFLNIDYGQDQHDPFLFNDMEKAVERILRALKLQEKVIIYGDYDADGVSASSLLYKVFFDLGFNNLRVYIPYRISEGYGMNEKAVKIFKKEGITLIITVDCGIANKKEIALARNLGIDVIVTDHHHEPLNPPDQAFAIINPKVKGEKYPFNDLAGVGVAFKVGQALVQKAKKGFRDLGDGYEKWLLDLVVIGTVTDCVDILGENRTLTKYGLLVLNKTRNIGLKRLVEKSRLSLGSLNASNISFQLGPRINAAGRIDHASTSFQLLISENEAEVKELVENIERTNQQRQRVTEKILQEALAQIGDDIGKKKVLFAMGEKWPTGVVGLVAGKISDQYYRPTFVMGRDKEEITGSGRSIPEFDIITTIEKFRQHLSRYGGHAQACGFTILGLENYHEFKKEIETYTEENLKGVDLSAKLSIDTEIELETINWHFFENLQAFEPYGSGNPSPTFLLSDLKVVNIENVGKNGNHLRLMVRHKTNEVKKLIGFNLGEWLSKMRIGDTIDAVVNLEENEWQGNKEIQLKLIDLKLK